MRALSLALLLVGCGKKDEAPPLVDTDPSDTDAAGDDDDGPAVTFTAHLVDGAATGVRHVTVGDVDGDGAQDMVASLSGATTELDIPPGSVALYTSNGALDSWTRLDILPTSGNVLQPNQPAIHDVDLDGDLDVIVPAGSPFCDPLPNEEACGAIYWLENADGAWNRKTIVQGMVTIYTSVVLADINADGIDDLVTSGEDLSLDGAQSLTTWFQGTGDGIGFRPTAQLIGVGGGPYPTVHDVDDDGDLDVVVGERTGASTFAWFEQTAPPSGGSPAGQWTRHVIDANSGAGWMLRFVPDLLGDGATVAVATNHTNTVRTNEPDTEESAVFVYQTGPDLRAHWTPTPISTGIVAINDLQIFPMEAPGTFEPVDIDGDGDLDLAVAGDGDPTFYLLEQTAPGTFETRVLRGSIPRNSGAVGDMDGDGDPEIVVTGQVHNVIYIVERN